MASQEAGAGWSSGPVQSTSRTGILESIHRMRLGKDCSSRDEPGLTSCLYRHSCSLRSKKPWKAEGREGEKEHVAVP